MYDTRKTNRWTGLGRNKGFEFYYDKYEKEYYKNRDTTAAIKRGLYGLIYIQKNLENASHDKIKKTWTDRDVAIYLDENIQWSFEQSAITIVANHEKIKQNNKHLLEKGYWDGERDFCNEEMNESKERTAYSWFEQAAGESPVVHTSFKPDLLGYVLMGYCALHGIGTQKNESQAKKFFDKANYNFELTARGYRLNED